MYESMYVCMYAYISLKDLCIHGPPVSAQVLLMGMASLPGDLGLMQREVFGALMPMYLIGAGMGTGASPNSLIVLSELWSCRRDLIIDLLVDMYARDPIRITRVLEICTQVSQSVE
jgi:hypothetical protein